MNWRRKHGSNDHDDLSYTGMFDTAGWPTSFDHLWQLHAVIAASQLRLSKPLVARLVPYGPEAIKALLALLDAQAKEHPEWLLAQPTQAPQGWEIGESYGWQMDAPGLVTRAQLERQNVLPLRLQARRAYLRGLGGSDLCLLAGQDPTLVDVRNTPDPDLAHTPALRAQRRMVEETTVALLRYRVAHEQRRWRYGQVQLEALRQARQAAEVVDDHRELALYRRDADDTATPGYRSFQYADMTFSYQVRALAQERLRAVGTAAAPWSALVAASEFGAHSAEWYRPFCYAIALEVPAKYNTSHRGCVARLYADGCAGFVHPFTDTQQWDYRDLVNERAHLAEAYGLTLPFPYNVTHEHVTWRLPSYARDPLIDLLATRARGEAGQECIPSTASIWQVRERYAPNQMAYALTNTAFSTEALAFSGDKARTSGDAPPAPPDFSAARAATHEQHRPAAMHVPDEISLLPPARVDTARDLAARALAMLLSKRLNGAISVPQTSVYAQMDELVDYLHLVDEWYAAVRLRLQADKPASEADEEQDEEQDDEGEEA